MSSAPRPFSTVLIANRGEIVTRIAHTCRALGLRTVAVFTEVDAREPFTRVTDSAIHIGGANAYLDIAAILRAAKTSGADAVHPGCGFLAERADFAKAVVDAGLTFIGPTAEAISLLGHKPRARELAKSAGLPILDGFEISGAIDPTVIDRCHSFGFPFLVKPSAGGGGKGIQIVRSREEVVSVLESATRFAKTTFGDGALLVERALQGPRHIEVQVLADHHGSIVHLFERDCSVQRRHQKLIEESPAQGLSEATRQKLCEAAVSLTRAAQYSNAGTVEFLVDASTEQFFFTEMNTRLQVEHRVTERRCGIDLVEAQLRIARGERLTLTQANLKATGHALEVRLCAENPTAGFRPAAGHVSHFEIPAAPWLTVDAGVATGSEVSVHYDSMIAKLIVEAPDRPTALARMHDTLTRSSVLGVRTNQAFLAEVLEHDAFRAGGVGTDWLRAPSVTSQPALDDAALVAATLVRWHQRHEARGFPRSLSGFRNNRFASQFDEFETGRSRETVEYRCAHDDSQQFVIRLRGNESRWKLVSTEPFTIETPSGERLHFQVAAGGRTLWLQHRALVWELTAIDRFPPPSAQRERGSLSSVMPGVIRQISVAIGARVQRGQTVLIIESMKMEQPTASPYDGVVTAIPVAVGQTIGAGVELIRIEPTLPEATSTHRPPAQH